MSMRVLSCVAAALLGTDFHAALAARPAKVDQQQQGTEQVEQAEQEQATDEKPKKVLDVQPDQEEEGANMAEVEAPQESAKPKTAEVQKSEPVADVQKREGLSNITVGGEDGVLPTTETEPETLTEASSGNGTGIGAYHLGTIGSSTCDFGVTVTETKCLAVGQNILADMFIKPGRDYLVAGSLANAPPGCSIHTLMDWAVTYNTNTQGENDGNFAEICHGKQSEVHGVKEGENQCDFGQNVKVGKCLDAINYVMEEIAGADASTQTKLNVGHWDTRPPGCSMHVGAGSNKSQTTTVAFYNTKTPATNDGSYVLVCTGTVVPVR